MQIIFTGGPVVQDEMQNQLDIIPQSSEAGHP